jgi:hypothetical protein
MRMNFESLDFSFVITLPQKEKSLAPGKITFPFAARMGNFKTSTILQLGFSKLFFLCAGIMGI